MIAAGLARYRSPDRSTWSYTLAGAARYGLSHFSTMSRVRQQARIAVSRKEFRKFGVKPLPPI